jgi:DNA repair photolyase
VEAAMIIKEIYAKNILSRSKVYEYTVNPYVGCQHACAYCYARYMKRFTGHREAWGDFVDVKVNAPELLGREIEKLPAGRVWVSGVCDCYQPLEKRYEITRKCLEILIGHDWPVTVQTKSPLVLRDIELFKQSGKIEVGMSVATADESIRKVFEPGAPPIVERIKALEQLHNAGIRTFAMIAPMLPEAAGLADMLAGNVDSVLVDRLNYHHADWVYRKLNLEGAMSDEFFRREGEKLAAGFKKTGVDCQGLY